MSERRVDQGGNELGNNEKMTLTSSGLRQGGQASASVRARPRKVMLALLKQSPVLVVLTAPPAIAGFIEGEIQFAQAMTVPSVIIGGLAVVSRGVKLDDDLRRIEAVATLALVFVLSGIVLMPGYLVLGLAPLDALFEGISGITTTGLSVARDASDWPISAHFLRGWSQWCGGVVVAVAGVALLMGSGRAARMMGEQSVGDGYLASTRTRARLILVVYVVLTVIAIIGLTLLIPGPWEGTMIALAAVSTGGFAPRADSLADYTLAAQGFTLFICIAGSISLLFYALAYQRGLRFALKKSLALTSLLIVVGGAFAFAALLTGINGWDPRDIATATLNQISAQTTAGFATGDVLVGSPVVLLMLAGMLIGGDVGSTTGGLKTGRVVLLARMVQLTLLRLRLPPSALSHIKDGDGRAKTDAVIFAAALMAIYLTAAALFWLALSSDGFEAIPALFDAVSALSGVGLSAGVIGPDLAGWLKGFAIFAMLLGRLEFFVLIALLLPSTWIKRR